MPKTTALVQMGLFNFALAKVFNIIMQTKRTMLQAVDYTEKLHGKKWIVFKHNMFCLHVSV
jgi:hypothetical protein